MLQSHALSKPCTPHYMQARKAHAVTRGNTASLQELQASDADQNDTEAVLW